ncbi:malamycin response protein 1 [Paraphoma chrysanthemicola]|uniref:Malamycin response protein 1 n=1 Tax=Paraphoma chrysanthemicola TaxID=798071 RepID=A0A8K0RGH1_9PLEO|nr:malamycin response protein 1 [Paraphoma chrysanthemicola]
MATQMSTSSTSKLPNESRRKIRDSCNNCSAQKIKCGKQRPSCARCTTKKLQCNYSYSQRTGRRSSSMNTQRDGTGSNVAFLPTIVDSPAVTSDPTTSLFGSTSSLTTTSPRKVHSNNATIESPRDIEPNPFDDPNFFPDLNFDFLASPPDTEGTASRSSSLHTTNDLTEANQLIDPEILWQSLPTSTPEFSFDGLKSFSSHPIFDLDQVGPFRKSLERTVQRAHDCMALALQVVNDLSVMREPCMVATSDPMTAIESSKTDIRDVDTVLFTNREAATSVKKILDCTCSNDQSVSLACYLATSKIISWYGAAIEAVGDRSENQERQTKMLLDTKSSQGTMAERIIARPIYMGKYCLDPEVQRVVRAQVVLGELKEHVQPLLHRLPRYHVTGLETDSDSTPNNMQACVLRDQLRTVIQNARNLNGSG